MARLNLKRVLRLDSVALDETYFTKEGYLVDCPIVTSVGIFEYQAPNGKIRRELRLPEYVFEKKSLESYKGMPIIVTHEAGAVDKSNVDEEIIGTILSDGLPSGDNVRAEIIIHDTMAMKKSGLRELSLGYNLVLEETPGMWRGEPYDAIQKEIRINHLALVQKARAGEKARLNIDGKSGKNFLKGEKALRRLPESMEKEIFGKKRDSFKEGFKKDKIRELVEDEEKLKYELDCLMEQKNNRDQNQQKLQPGEVIKNQDEELRSLWEILQALLAKRDEDDIEAQNKYSNKWDKNFEEDEDEELTKDNIDKIVRNRMELGRIGDSLDLKGLESLEPMEAKKTIIKKARPRVKLDGQKKGYIDALFDLVVDEINQKKGFNMVKPFNSDGFGYCGQMSLSDNAREKMLRRTIGGMR